MARGCVTWGVVADIPPPRYRQHGNTVNERSVHILLECIVLKAKILMKAEHAL